MLIIALFQCEKIQAVRVFQNIYRKMALFCRQLGREISDGPAVLAEVISVYDVFQFTFAAENGGYPPTQNGDIRSLFWLFSLMALQN